MKIPVQALRILQATAVVTFGCALVWWLLGCPATGIDDADIFFVYARNFAEGHGFVYNIGTERVEGFTSLLWTLVCAGFFTLFESVEAPLLVLNVLLGIAVCAACLRRTDHPGWYLLLLAAAPGWFAWCQVSLMESGLWCALLTGSILAVAERKPRPLLLLLPLLVLTRPESMLWGAWLVLVFGVGNGVKATLPLAASFVLTLLALVGFRWGYFGYPFPNTYYAKVSPDLLANIGGGLRYLGGYLVLNPVVLVVSATGLAALFRAKRCSAESFRIALCLLPGIAIPVWVGGDHFGSFRFFQPLWPLLCLVAAREWTGLRAVADPRPEKLVLPGLLLCGWLLFPSTGFLKHEFRIAREGRATGRALEAMFRSQGEYPSVGAITAGGIKYAYPGPVLDLMGLNSTEMAHHPGSRVGLRNHSAFNPDVFYRWQPELVLCGDSAAFDERVLKGIQTDPRFLARYAKRTFRHEGHSFDAWCANGLIGLNAGEAASMLEPAGTGR